MKMMDSLDRMGKISLPKEGGMGDRIAGALEFSTAVKIKIGQLQKHGKHKTKIFTT